ncbi:MAG: hypothetical protein ACYCUM_12480 [Solirubrobacteraceae bacterium]
MAAEDRAAAMLGDVPLGDRERAARRRILLISKTFAALRATAVEAVGVEGEATRSPAQA